MKYALLIFVALSLQAQGRFSITGTVIPSKLLKLNYGPMPKGVFGMDFNVCNITKVKQDLVSGQVYQALLGAQSDYQPIGGEILFAAILHNQNNSFKSWLSIGLTSTTSVLSVLGTSKSINISSGATNGLALGALLGQALLNAISPALQANQLQTFQAQVLPPQIAVASESCIEKTVFVISTKPQVKQKINKNSIASPCLWLTIN